MAKEELENENVEMKKQLTKAKEIILTLINNFAYPIGREDWTVEDEEIVDKAEQFIREVEKWAKKTWWIELALPWKTQFYIKIGKKDATF